jgi:dienelactone hydrolase
MSGDEQKNSQFFNALTGSSDSQKELQASAQSFAAISPATYYKDIHAAIQIHHGTADSVIPVAWAQETCKALQDAKRDVACYYYDGAEHTFRTRDLEVFGPRVDDFFARLLIPRP